ncbi:MAG: ABC transporter ATP-binding protein/permease, partial [Tannerella sp.]|nr:ABC transporter ATP-binding protein/permease [Tannerella sp.]
MKRIKTLLGLSDEGYRNFRRAVAAVVISNLTLLPPFVVMIQVIVTLLEPLASGRPPDTEKLWCWLGCGIVAALLYFFACRNEYRQTYVVAYRESEKIRLDVAERIRKLPMSFFNNRDLSELTTNMMADCTSVEHVMSHVVPGLFANIITVTLACVMLAFYDWRLSLALFAALPVSFGLIFFSRKLQEKLGERHVQAKLDVSDRIQEYLDGIKVVKAFGLSGEKFESLRKSLYGMRRNAIRFEGLTGTFITLAMMIMQTGIGLVVLAGVLLLADGGFDAVKFLTFAIVSIKIYSPLIVILTLMPEFFYMLISTRRMQKLRGETVVTGDETVVLSNFDIELKNVTFAYRETDAI